MIITTEYSGLHVCRKCSAWSHCGCRELGVWFCNLWQGKLYGIAISSGNKNTMASSLDNSMEARIGLSI